MADEDETGNPLARLTEGRPHAWRVSSPAGHPARDIAERMGRNQQVHAGRAARQLLLPDRNLVIGNWRGNQDEKLPRIMGELMLFLMVGVSGARLLFRERLAQQRLERIALILRDGDKPPGRELAVVRGPRGYREDLLHLLCGRSWPFQLARFSRTAGFPQRRPPGSGGEHPVIHP